jgi:hypothetical protein
VASATAQKVIEALSDEGLGQDEFHGTFVAQLRAPAHQRGTYSRFHRGDKDNEVSLYRTVADELAAAGWPVIHYEVAGESAEVVAAVLLSAILKRLAMRSG